MPPVKTRYYLTCAWIRTKAYPSRLNLDVSKEGGCPAGTLLINTSTLLAEEMIKKTTVRDIKQTQGATNQANMIACRHCTFHPDLSVTSLQKYTEMLH